MASLATSGRSICSACRRQLHLSLSRRTFSSAVVQRADQNQSTTNDVFKDLNSAAVQQVNQVQSSTTDASKNFSSGRRRSQPLPDSIKTTSTVLDILDANEPEDARSAFLDAAGTNLNNTNTSPQPHRLHIYAHRHNTHITFIQPPKSAALTISSSVSSTSSSAAERKKMVDVLLSVSTGNIGFKKAGRGTYDAAYQLGAYVMKQIQEKGMLRDIRRLEVVLRGFGAGREAVTKILLGTEGRLIRDRITSVVDATRLKFGGNRSPKPRRLG